MEVTIKVSDHQALLFPRQGLINKENISKWVLDHQLKDYLVFNGDFSYLLLCLSSSNGEEFFIQGIISDQIHDNDILVSESSPLDLQDSYTCTVLHPFGLLLQTIVIQPLNEDSLHYSLNSMFSSFFIFFLFFSF